MSLIKNIKNLARGKKLHRSLERDNQKHSHEIKSYRRFMGRKRKTSCPFSDEGKTSTDSVIGLAGKSGKKALAWRES